MGQGSRFPLTGSTTITVIAQATAVMSQVRLLDFRIWISRVDRPSALRCTGTSACYHGQLYCGNRGFEPKLLSSSFVDDSVCGESTVQIKPSVIATSPRDQSRADCCDGSDEQPGVCKNTCLEASKHERDVSALAWADRKNRKGSSVH